MSIRQESAPAKPETFTPEDLLQRLTNALEENERLRLIVARKERSNLILAQLNEQSERLWAAHEEEKKLQYLYNDLLLKNTPNTVLLFDESLRYVLGSEPYSPLVADSPGGLTNKPLLQVFSPKVEPGWVAKIHDYSQTILRTGDFRRFSDTVRIDDCPPLSVQVMMRPIMEGGGRIRGVVVTITDVSELVIAQRKAEEAARSKSDFLANMSHEIRTPMNAILGIAEILLHGRGLDSAQRKYIDDIKMSADSLLTIINDILDISKLEVGKMSLSPATFDFAHFLENIRSFATFIASEKDLSFQYETAGTLPELLKGDDVRLRQVIINLLSNAVKFTPAGTVTLRVVAEAETLRFDIQDTGIGIRPEDRAGLFQPFKQIDTTRNRSIKGTGLGLSIAKSIVGLMGGSIGLESVYGRGSTFSFVIPKLPGDEKEMVKANDHTRVFYAKSVRILIVDDNEINLSVAVGLLKTLYDLESDQAQSGPEALEKVAVNRYDLIFMDHMMPDMDGVETAHRIRQMDGWRKTVPIIALTANAVSGAKEMLLASNMDDFLSKPLQKAELDRILTVWIPPGCQLTRRSGGAIPPRGSSQSDRSRQEAAGGDYRGVTAMVAKWPEINVIDGMETAADQQEVFERSLRLLGIKIPELCILMEKLLAERNLPELAVHVHGLKSSLASVGAGALSHQAKDVEFAAGMGDAAYCQEYLPRFVRDLQALGQKLTQAFQEGAGLKTAVRQGETAFLRDGLRGIQQALAQYDHEAIGASLTPLLGLDFGGGTNSLLGLLKDKVDTFDYEGANDFIRFHFP